MQAPHSHRPLSVGRVATQRAHCDLAYSRRRVSAQPQARFGEDDGFDRLSLSLPASLSISNREGRRR
jgi:hypothetical protein